MQIIHYVCLLPIKGRHKIKYGSTVSAEPEERLLWFSRVLSGNLNLGSGAVALFDMPNLNRFDILSISIFCKIALSISISISIFSKITISISIFLELPYRYRYRYRYFSELPYRYRYFQLLHIDIDIDIDIFQKCRYIDNRYFISIF